MDIAGTEQDPSDLCFSHLRPWSQKETQKTDTARNREHPVAVLMVGLVAVGIVFLVLGGLLYLKDEPSDQRALSSPPARSFQATDRSAAN